MKKVTFGLPALAQKALMVVLGGSTLLVSGCGGSSAGTVSDEEQVHAAMRVKAAAPHNIWVAGWADAPANAGGSAGSGQTFREIVKPTVGGNGTIRLHFSNYFGSGPITIGTVHVGKQVQGAQVGNDVAVTFGGAQSVTIPAGGMVVSDNVAFAFNYGDILAVTEYLPGSWTALTQHNQGPNIVTSYATPNNAGDETGDVAGTSFTQTTYETYLLDRVDVYGPYKGTIAAFGSSTTDGFHSSLDKHMTYPEQLAADLHAAGRNDIAVANVGIAGNRVLVNGSGMAGTSRFARDVLGLPGVIGVIDALGGNDLRVSCVPASSLITGIQNLVAQAHAAGIKYYRATTAPSTYCGAQNPGGFGTRYGQGAGEEHQRFVLNDWEMSPTPYTVDGVVEPVPAFDGLFHFSRDISDPNNWSYMLPQYDSGDDIHPNDVGYGVIAKSIPTTTF